MSEERSVLTQGMLKRAWDRLEIGPSEDTIRRPRDGDYGNLYGERYCWVFEETRYCGDCNVYPCPVIGGPQRGQPSAIDKAFDEAADIRLRQEVDKKGA